MSISYLMTLAALPDDPLHPTSKPDSLKALIETSAAHDASDHPKPISPNDARLQVVPAPSTSPLVELIAEDPSTGTQKNSLVGSSAPPFIHLCPALIQAVLLSAFT
jgi:hypothetical protein